MTPLGPLARLVPAGLRPLLAAPRGASGQEDELAAALGVEVGELAAIRPGPRYHYRPFSVEKPCGGARRIVAPSPGLKRVQRALLDNALARLPVHPCATAFYRGASTVRNARPHARARLVATVDLRDFFESTRAARVRGFLAGQGWRGEALRTLMRVCVYRDGLPQGAPTSPCLSNLVNVPLDERLERLARRSGAAYTRYGDDLTFSWRSGALPGGFTAAVEDALGAVGYEVQSRKGWRVVAARDRPVVTGLVLAGDGRLRIPWALRLRGWRLRVRSWWPGGADASARLRGYRGYAAMVRRGSTAWGDRVW